MCVFRGGLQHEGQGVCAGASAADRAGANESLQHADAGASANTGSSTDTSVHTDHPHVHRSHHQTTQGLSYV